MKFWQFSLPNSCHMWRHCHTQPQVGLLLAQAPPMSVICCLISTLPPQPLQYLILGQLLMCPYQMQLSFQKKGKEQWNSVDTRIRWVLSMLRWHSLLWCVSLDSLLTSTSSPIQGGIDNTLLKCVRSLKLGGQWKVLHLVPGLFEETKKLYRFILYKNKLIIDYTYIYVYINYI